MNMNTPYIKDECKHIISKDEPVRGHGRSCIQSFPGLQQPCVSAHNVCIYTCAHAHLLTHTHSHILTHTFLFVQVYAHVFEEKIAPIYLVIDKHTIIFMLYLREKLHLFIECCNNQNHLL